MQTFNGTRPPKAPTSVTYAQFTVEAKTHLLCQKQKVVSYTGKANDFGIITATIALAEKERHKNQKREGLALTILPYRNIKSQVEIRNLNTDIARVVWLEDG